MNHNKFIDNLKNIRANFYLGIASTYLLSEDNVIDRLKGKKLKVFNDLYSLDNSVPFLNLKKDTKKAIVFNFFIMNFRTFFKETFELITDYSKQTSQFNLFKAQNWYHITRIIRNSLSHDLKIQYTEFDKTLLPLTFKKIHLTENLNGKDLDFQTLPLPMLIDLYNDMADFASNDLK